MAQESNITTILMSIISLFHLGHIFYVQDVDDSLLQNKRSAFSLLMVTFLMVT